MNNKIIVIGSDDAGLELKDIIFELLKTRGFIVEDQGVTEKSDTTMYPLIAKRVCERIIQSGYTKQGILICGTGIGMALVSNKFPGIYAAVCHDPYSAERSKRSNNCNLMCMGARVIGVELAKKLTNEWLSYDTVDEKSRPKVEAIVRIDNETRK
jgi:ribose 5-phosphate isomerase B